jgi:hypothetical protein
MLSRIPSNTARPLLEEVNRLQDNLFLGLVNLPADHAWTDNRALAAWVKTLGGWSLVPSFVDDRFKAKNSVWSKHSAVIASSTIATKTAMRRAWESHRKAQNAYTNGGSDVLEMPDWAASSTWKALHALMSSFYDAALGIGDFSLANGQTINRRIYIAGFGKLAVCPYWDCGFVSGEAQLDHFLPISLFPFLSVCPDNLVPVSDGPNRRGHKGDEVPLDSATPPQTHRTATEWFHPSWLNAVGKIDVDVSRAPTKIFSVQLRPVAMRWSRQVTNYDKLVDLSNYWTAETNTRWRDDLTTLAQEMNRYGPTATGAVQGRLDDLLAADQTRPFTLLDRGKFSFSLRDASTLKEIADQASELRTKWRNN